MRRRLFIALAFLLAGAVVNVAVAWGCVMWSPLHDASVSQRQRTMIETAFIDHFGLDEDTRPPHTAHNWGRGVTVWFADRSRPIEHQDNKYLFLFEAGWPLRGVHGRMWGAGSSHGLRGVIRAPWTISRKGSTRALPLIPIWPGFIANSLFYAVVLWLLIPGPFALRRLIRRRRGLCPKCGYPMGEAAVCSECGRALPGRAEAAT